METWRTLFDRAVDCGATEADVLTALAARRDGADGDGPVESDDGEGEGRA